MHHADRDIASRQEPMDVPFANHNDAIEHHGTAAIDTRQLAERYVALWNEPDPDVRRAIIETLWAPDGTQVLEPPQAVREAARDLAFPAPPLVVRGHGELDARASRAYEKFVAPGEFVFRARGNASRLHDVVKLGWEMARVSDGEVVGAGLDVFVLGQDGRIRVDHQFIEL